MKTVPAYAPRAEAALSRVVERFLQQHKKEASSFRAQFDGIRKLLVMLSWSVAKRVEAGESAETVPWEALTALRNSVLQGSASNREKHAQWFDQHDALLIELATGIANDLAAPILSELPPRDSQSREPLHSNQDPDVSMNIVTFYNHKGGSGKTTLAYHTCLLAEELGIRTVAVSVDTQGDMIKWLTRGAAVRRDRIYEVGKHVTAVYSPDEFPARLLTGNAKLVLVDMDSRDDNPKRLPYSHLWLMPIHNRFSMENSLNVLEAMNVPKDGTGRFWVHNRVGYGGQRHKHAVLHAIQQKLVETWPVSIIDAEAVERAIMKYEPAWKHAMIKDSQIERDLRAFALSVFKTLRVMPKKKRDLPTKEDEE